MRYNERLAPAVEHGQVHLPLFIFENPELRNLFDNIVEILVSIALDRAQKYEKAFADLPDKALRRVGEALSRWTLTPNGTEGYKKAEVTRGGVDTRELSSATMMSARVPGLYFIGEAVDVTGWLGGYNFQWAWASGVAAGQAAAEFAGSPQTGRA